MAATWNPPNVSAMDGVRARGQQSGRQVPLLTIGFRPLYMLAGAIAAAAVPAWHFAPGDVLPGEPYLEGSAWHAHDMVFGFAAAVLAGYPLTAAPAPTRRTHTPLTGPGLHPSLAAAKGGKA